MLIESPSGELTEFEIEKDDDETLGFSFSDSLLAPPMHCRNRCVFCFVDQLPPGMRESLYVKDDDMRLSFLTGNYITLTNLTDDEFKPCSATVSLRSMFLFTRPIRIYACVCCVIDVRCLDGSPKSNGRSEH